MKMISKDNKIFWCDKEVNDFSTQLSIIVPHVTFVMELCVDEDERGEYWFFNIGLNGTTHLFTYTDKKEAHQRYHDLISKISEYWNRKGM